MPDNLALRMRPRSISEVIGQKHLVGEGKIIRRMVEANMLSSMILYGPPGIGKTSIASAIAGTTKFAFRTFNATVDSKKRLQEIAEEAKFSGGLVLLLDEIHRLDKAKQDFLLPLLENGNIIMIGATTENPFFSVTPAIRSRVQIFELEPLSNEAYNAVILLWIKMVMGTMMSFLPCKNLFEDLMLMPVFTMRHVWLRQGICLV